MTEEYRGYTIIPLTPTRVEIRQGTTQVYASVPAEEAHDVIDFLIGLYAE